MCEMNNQTEKEEKKVYNMHKIQKITNCVSIYLKFSPADKLSHRCSALSSSRAVEDYRNPRMQCCSAPSGKYNVLPQGGDRVISKYKSSTVRVHCLFELYKRTIGMHNINIMPSLDSDSGNMTWWGMTCRKDFPERLEPRVLHFMVGILTPNPCSQGLKKMFSEILQNVKYTWA